MARGTGHTESHFEIPLLPTCEPKYKKPSSMSCTEIGQYFYRKKSSCELLQISDVLCSIFYICWSYWGDKPLNLRSNVLLQEKGFLQIQWLVFGHQYHDIVFLGKSHWRDRQEDISFSLTKQQTDNTFNK